MTDGVYHIEEVGPNRGQKSEENKSAIRNPKEIALCLMLIDRNAIRHPLSADAFFGHAETHRADSLDLGFQGITGLEFFLKLRRVGISGRDEISRIERRHLG